MSDNKEVFPGDEVAIEEEYLPSDGTFAKNGIVYASQIGTRASFELSASAPPLNMTAFPDFRHRDMICGTTSGLDSNITPMTPIGHLTW